MKGFPKHLNTRADYLYIKEHSSPELWRPRFQALLNERFSWLPAGPLADGEPGNDDESHRVVEMRDETGQTVVSRVQEEYREDPNAVIFRLGFTVEEVEKALA
jgi:hypothetical protein